MKRALAAFAVVTVASVSAIAATQAQVPAKNEQVAQASDSERGQPDMRRGPHGRDHGREQGRRGPRGERMQMWLAQNLNAAETLIGIRADQHDAWRDYTNALLAMFQPPARPAVVPDANAEPAPFAREERLIQNVTDRAAKAAELSKAIDALKAKLTPEQLTKLANADLRFGPPMGPGGPGRGPHGHGPHGGHGPMDRGGPQGGPDDMNGPGPGGNDAPDDGGPDAGPDAGPAE
ncbi:hypothetical protein [Kaistia sp. MMO-174]|uniref:hypothetical protein n=1 Tax=Kaistia sp. MMO-174 TaxID=3081256 RepID=UPI001AD122CC|nr:hypothetical protein [Hyphomicrobiales bacterium]MBN9058623.1 hypothetical protein [Hyphomicrobiales bacterium]